MMAQHRLRFFTSLLPAALLLGGCAELVVHRMSPDAARAPLIGKIPYSLPKTTVIVSGQLTLAKCETAYPKDPASTEAPKLTLEFEKKVQVASIAEPDGDHRYYIDYEAARSLFKDLHVTVETLPNKTLKSFSGAVADQAGAIAVAAAGAAIGIRGAVGVGRVPLRAPVEDDRSLTWMSTHPERKAHREPYCRTEILEALAAIESQKQVIRAARESKRQAIERPSLPPEYLQANLALKDQEIAKAQARIAETEAHSGIVRTFTARWSPTHPAGTALPGNGHVLLRHAIEMWPVVAEWFTGSGRRWITTSPADSNAAVWRQARAPITIELNVDNSTIGASSPSAATADAPAGDMPKGLVVRDPAVGVLRLCDGSCGTSALDGGVLVGRPEDIATNSFVVLPQLGRLLVLPLRNALFQSSKLSVSLNADGTLASVGLQASGSLAQGLAGTAAAAKDEMAATAAHNASRAAQAQFPTLVNQAIANCLTASAAITAAGGTPVPCQ